MEGIASFNKELEEEKPSIFTHTLPFSVGNFPLTPNTPFMGSWVENLEQIRMEKAPEERSKRAEPSMLF